ncbi:glycosyltransferase family 2 protein, partial [Bacillus sp. HC-Mk]
MMNEKNLPLVSILIPTYNRPHYFKIALESALAQTYSNIEIIIGDDSTNDETATLIREQYLPNYKNIPFNGVSSLYNLCVGWESPIRFP